MHVSLRVAAYCGINTSLPDKKQSSRAGRPQDCRVNWLGSYPSCIILPIALFLQPSGGVARGYRASVHLFACLQLTSQQKRLIISTCNLPLFALSHADPSLCSDGLFLPPPVSHCQISKQI
jgi:hypothetical protein